MRAETLGLAALAAWCAPAPAPVVPLVAGGFDIARKLADRTGVAITFDDGPHPSGTPAVLEILERAGVRATFFLVGEQVARWPSVAAEVSAAGHEIGVHGFRHTLLLRRAPRFLRDDFARAEEALGEATGASLDWYRPPYGVFSLAALILARRRGWTPLLWSRWGRDWSSRATPASIAACAASNLRAGDVLLLHDADHYSSTGSWRRTVAALPAIIDAVDASSLPFVTPSQST